MLDIEPIAEQASDADTWQDDLIEVDHVTLLQCLRQVSAQLTREFVATSEMSSSLAEDGTPVPIEPSRLCALMQPFLCMN